MLIRLTPAPLIRAAGRLQFRYPATRSIINWVGQRFAGRGTIARGPGKGLKFDARGCNPGFLAGTSEPLEQQLVARYARPGGVVYDLGANAGFYVVIAARAVGPDGRVFAFEPAPALADRVEANARANRFGNVSVVRSAVCDVDGTIDFGLAGELSVSNSINAVAADPAAAVTRVPSTTLDTFAAGHLPPTLVLIDIEGAELAALRGSLGVIARHRPILMVEVHWLGDAFVDFVRHSLEPLGYTATTYSGGPLPTGVERYHALCLPPPVEQPR